MICEKIMISAHDLEAPAYTYILDNVVEVDPEKKRPLVIITPGGGYERTSGREAEPVALRFNSAGYHVIILRYSVRPAVFPTALLQLAQVVKMARSKEKEWNVDVNQIIVCGFSAGGHLAASLGVFWNKGLIEKELGGFKEDYRPNALILNYPVISSGEFAHQGSIQNIYGGDEKFAQENSLENLVDAETPTTFLWHTMEDPAVALENSMLFASALRKKDVPFELHIYQYGGHGLSLGIEETGNPGTYANVTTWITLAVEWVRCLQ